jgi:hypothetical protein
VKQRPRGGLAQGHTAPLALCGLDQLSVPQSPCSVSVSHGVTLLHRSLPHYSPAPAAPWSFKLREGLVKRSAVKCSSLTISIQFL